MGNKGRGSSSVQFYLEIETEEKIPPLWQRLLWIFLPESIRKKN
jgi:hypothetical protein